MSSSFLYRLAGKGRIVKTENLSHGYVSQGVMQQASFKPESNFSYKRFSHDKNLLLQ